MISHRHILIILLSVVLAQLSGCSDEPGSEETRHVLVGLLTNNPNGMKNIQGFRDTMASLGYTEGENVAYTTPGKPVKGDALDAAIQEMVAKPVDLIFTAGTPTGVAAYRLTRDQNVPVVFGVIADPIRAGVLDDLQRPGGNITGVMISQNHARRLELFLQIAPAMKRLLVAFNPGNSASTSAYDQIAPVAKSHGVELVAREVKNSDDVSRVLESLASGIDGIFMLPDSTVNRHQQELINRAIEHKLPVSGPSIVQVEKGALTAYGIVHTEAGGQAAGVADKILRGTPPGEIPVEAAGIFLGVNLSTAGKLSIHVEDNILRQAHTIIRDTAGE